MLLLQSFKEDMNRLRYLESQFKSLQDENNKLRLVDNLTCNSCFSLAGDWPVVKIAIMLPQVELISVLFLAL